MNVSLSQLQPGDVLLYKPSSVFGYAIAWLTAGWVSHVELYAGDGYAYASRDGRGVSLYDARLDGLAEVRRSTVPLDRTAMHHEFAKRSGHRYDYATIGKFLTFGKGKGRTDAEVCSELATILLRAGGHTDLFGTTAPDEISPRDFQKQETLPRIF